MTLKSILNRPKEEALAPVEESRAALMQALPDVVLGGVKGPRFKAKFDEASRNFYPIFEQE